jgi:hypothetical protein
MQIKFSSQHRDKPPHLQAHLTANHPVRAFLSSVFSDHEIAAVF